jgi:hypothetical protein
VKETVPGAQTESSGLIVKPARIPENWKLNFQDAMSNPACCFEGDQTEDVVGTLVVGVQIE